MCGIFGSVQLAGGSLQSPEGVRDMGELLRHRGPDSGSCLESPSAIVGARRLSIIDLAVEANQPFASPDGQVWLACNGEIYNSPELRKRYTEAGYPFRSRHNDVEAILPLYLEHGVEAVERLDGMFGLAIWDARKGTLLLARDRAGEKPLFYCQRDGELRFGSEIQTLLSLESSVPDVSPEGLADYLTLGYCTAPRTMYRDIHKLEAGHLLEADASGIRVRRYWDPVKAAMNESPVKPAQVLETFESALGRQVLSDVPIGVFTSGGLDSSLLVASAIRHLPPASVHTYAVRFENESYDESSWAERVCRDLGTVHHVVSASESELRRALDHVAGCLAEPLGDPAILPTYLLADAARADVKVILSGEGADELFGGYPTYLGHRWADRFQRLPSFVRSGVRGMVHRLPVTTRKVSLEFLARRFVDEAERGARERHLSWFGLFGTEAAGVGKRCGDSAVPGLWSHLESLRGPVKQAMVFDLMTYLAENLLTKVDRATMMASIEARAPYLNQEVMELALRQPAGLSVGSLRTKRTLKRAALARLPRAVVYRRKRGLSVPVSDWINGSLREEVDDLLDGGNLARQDVLDPEPIRRLLEEHRSHKADHGRRLWPLFVLQKWLEGGRIPEAWRGAVPAAAG